jgi:hypothetical protein
VGNVGATLLPGPLFDAYDDPTEGETLVAQSITFILDES